MTGFDAKEQTDMTHIDTLDSFVWTKQPDDDKTTMKMHWMKADRIIDDSTKQSQ